MSLPDAPALETLKYSSSSGDTFALINMTGSNTGDPLAYGDAEGLPAALAANPVTPTGGNRPVIILMM